MIEGLSQLKQEIKKTKEGSNWCVFSYKDDFSTLWKENSIPDLCSNSDEIRINILIIWDGMPDALQGVNILDHLTPFDWALSFSYQQLGNKGHQLWKIRLHILDCHSLHQPNAFSVKMLPALCHAMPWMKVFRPCSLNEEYGPRLLLSDLYGLLQDDSHDFDRIGQDALNQVESIVHAWQGSVARSTDHHGINNILGPIVLGKPMDIKIGNNLDPKTRSLWVALSEHASRMGMTTKSVESSKTKGLLKDIKSTICENARKLGRIDFVLIDDQPAWEEVLGQICKHDIEDALVSFERFKSFTDVSSEWESGDYRGKMKPHPEKGSLQVLFADLRLFADSKEEVEYFKQSIEYAESVLRNLEESKAQRPWQDNDFSTGKLDTLKEKIDSIVTQDYKEFQKDNAYLELLTIRVRAIAQADPLLPIILFSSSGQRHIMESVRGYKNIITDLEKPRFFGYQDGDSSLVFLRAFKDALDKAFSLLAARVALQDLNKVAEESCVKLETTNTTNTEKKDCYIEIFIDESGTERNKNFSVGGMALLYSGSNIQEGKNYADELHNNMSDNAFQILLPGGSWYPTQQNNCKGPLKWCKTKNHKIIDKWLGTEKDSIKVSNKNYAELLKDLLTEIDKLCLQKKYIDNWFFFNLKGETTEKIIEKTDHFDENHLDNLNCSLIRHLLDVVIYEFFRAHLSQYTEIHVQVYGATRERHKPDQKIYTDEEKENLFIRFGISVYEDSGNHWNDKKRDTFYFSLKRDSMLPIFSSVVNTRPEKNEWTKKIKPHGGLCSIIGGIGCPNINEFPFRHIHHLADTVPTIGNFKSHKQLIEIFSILTKKENQIMTDTLDESFKQSLKAGKYLDSGDFVESFVCAWKAAEDHYTENRKIENPCSIVPIICDRVKGKLSVLNGDELIEFGNRVKISRKTIGKGSGKRAILFLYLSKVDSINRIDILTYLRRLEAGEQIEEKDIFINHSQERPYARISNIPGNNVETLKDAIECHIKYNFTDNLVQTVMLQWPI